jgi:hypothetical protein
MPYNGREFASLWTVVVKVKNLGSRILASVTDVTSG